MSCGKCGVRTKPNSTKLTTFLVTGGQETEEVIVAAKSSIELDDGQIVRVLNCGKTLRVGKKFAQALIAKGAPVWILPVS